MKTANENIFLKKHVLMMKRKSRETFCYHLALVNREEYEKNQQKREDLLNT